MQLPNSRIHMLPCAAGQTVREKSYCAGQLPFRIGQCPCPAAYFQACFGLLNALKIGLTDFHVSHGGRTLLLLLSAQD